MSDAHRGSLKGSYQCDCGAAWPEFLRLRIDLPGCPACNDAWARWPASARGDTDDGDDAADERAALAP